MLVRSLHGPLGGRSRSQFGVPCQSFQILLVLGSVRTTMSHITPEPLGVSLNHGSYHILDLQMLQTDLMKYPSTSRRGLSSDQHLLNHSIPVQCWACHRRPLQRPLRLSTRVQHWARCVRPRQLPFQPFRHYTARRRQQCQARLQQRMLATRPAPCHQRPAAQGTVIEFRDCERQPQQGGFRWPIKRRYQSLACLSETNS